MLNIYICEDNKEQRSIVTKYVNNVILIEESDLNLSLSTDNPHDVLATMDENKGVGLYFLDIDLGSDINGLTLAQMIRQKDPRGFIVFITTHSEMCYMTFTYKVEAMDFITKDDSDNLHSRIHQCINKAYSRYSSSNNFTGKILTVKVGDKEYCISHEEIIYIETSPNPHKIILHTEESTFEFKGKIKDIHSSLGNNFAICHRSTIVNKYHIKEIDTKERTVTLSNNDICIVSSRYLRDLTK